jgi:hypothetical protein
MARPPASVPGGDLGPCLCVGRPIGESRSTLLVGMDHPLAHHPGRPHVSLVPLAPSLSSIYDISTVLSLLSLLLGSCSRRPWLASPGGGVRAAPGLLTQPTTTQSKSSSARIHCASA